MKYNVLFRNDSSGTIKLRLEYSIFLMVAFSFILQPLNIRPLSIPVSLLLLAMLLFYSFAKVRYKVEDLAFIAPALIILFFHDYLINQQSRSLVFLCLLLVVVNYRRRAITAPAIRMLWIAIGWSCVIVTIVGYYRFFSGYKSELSENVDGFVGVVDQYFYMGISYLPSTRNSDAVYFSIGALIFLWRLRNGIGINIVNVCIFYFSLSAALLSMSRGIWIALLVAIFFSYKSRFVLRFISPVMILGLAFLLIYQPFVFEMIYTSFVSIFDPESANKNVSGFYSYSNDKRLEIYILALYDIVSYPFGYGVSFIPSYSSVLENLDSVHSENIYLDFLIILGIFSIPIFVYIFKLIRDMRGTRNSDIKSISKSVIYFLIVYHIFNSGVDFTFTWFVFVVAILGVNLLSKAERSDDMVFSKSKC